MRLVDWSKDGSLLLTEAVSWTYESDSGKDYNAFIYDVSTGLFQQPPVYPLFKEFFKKECEFQVKTEGFDVSSNVILKVSLHCQIPMLQNQISCVKTPTLFLYDMRKNSIQELPSNYKIQHYGKFVDPVVVNGPPQ